MRGGVAWFTWTSFFGFSRRPTSGEESRSERPESSRSTRSSLSSRDEQPSSSLESRLRTYLIAVAVIAFIGAPVVLVLAEAFGFTREGFRTDLSMVGLFIGAVLMLLGVKGVDEWIKRR